SARSVIDVHKVTGRLESTDNIAVIIFSREPAASQRFVDDLAKSLESVPRNVLAGVEYRITDELRFFTERRPLYMDLEDLVRIRDYIGDRIHYEKELYNPLNIFRSTHLPEPRLDLRQLEEKYLKRTSLFTKFPDGYFATEDKGIRILIANLPGKLSGI